MNGQRCDIKQNEGGCGTVIHCNNNECLENDPMENGEFTIIDHVADSILNKKVKY